MTFIFCLFIFQTSNQSCIFSSFWLQAPELWNFLELRAPELVKIRSLSSGAIKKLRLRSCKIFFSSSSWAPELKFIFRFWKAQLRSSKKIFFFAARAPELKFILILESSAPELKKYLFSKLGLQSCINFLSSWSPDLIFDPTWHI